MNQERTALQAPEESAEAAYRRGYADGYLVAVNDMATRPHRLSMMHLLEEQIWFWETALCRWQGGDCAEKVPPPQFMPEDSTGWQC